MLPKEVILDIQSWIKAPSSKLLWVEGPGNASFGNQLSLAAIAIGDLSTKTGIPCISFFPKSRFTPAPRDNSSVMSSQDMVLIALLYSLAGQLVRLLPAKFESHEGFKERSYNNLDGSLGSAAAALDLTESLFAHIAKPLIIVIDKIHLADHQTTREHLTRLITILRDYGRREIIKVLFTTAGSCRVLANTTRVRERVDAARLAQVRPGQPPKGWSSLNDMRLS